MKLSDLPNIGKTMEQRLAAVDINDAETLMHVGSQQAFVRLMQLEGDTCFSSLCALEGAIQGVRWHHLSPDTKEELKKIFELYKK